MQIRFRTIVGTLLGTALLAATALAPAIAAAPPEEGMWLPININRLNYDDMKKMGLKLTQEELHSINNSSLKDAVVHFGGFCSAEIISQEGLVLTNHHCGYDAIAGKSTPIDNILTNGWWAKNKQEEKPIEGLFVKFLVRMEDVSAKVLAATNDGMTEKERSAAVAKIGSELKKEAEAGGKGYTADIKEFFNGNEYYMLVYETYNDIRLVGTPPESIGKFGGDTDNWMWPRHTGDFSMFRIYANTENKPAPYNAANVPLKPRHFFPVNIGGVKPGDFSMIFGYPGRTDRYASSFSVQNALDISDPATVKIRERKLVTMKAFMDKSVGNRLKYASAYAAIANYWKFFIGEQQGLRRLNVVGQKQKEEADFTAWVGADAGRKARYGTVLADLQSNYTKMRSFETARTYYRECFLGQKPDLITLGFLASGVADAIKADTIDKKETDKAKQAEASKGHKEELEKAKKELKDAYAEIAKEYDEATDQKIMAEMIALFMANVPADQQPEYLKNIYAQNGKDAARTAAFIFTNSAFTNSSKMDMALAKPDAKKLDKDPAIMLATAIRTTYLGMQQGKIAPIQAEMVKATRLFVEGNMKRLDGVKKLYPNANSTMRMTYGKVADYNAKDAVHYLHMTTLEGIIEKEDSLNEEFVVPKKLKDLWRKKDYGQYAENGTVPVGFLTTNDITGGNSGSPVLNAHGEIIGTAFDGNWEAMSGNIAFEPALQRTIICDIRYVLFCIEKLGGAENLIKEMKIVGRHTEDIAMPAPPAPAPAVPSMMPPPPAPKSPKAAKTPMAPKAKPPVPFAPKATRPAVAN